ncbi:MAG: hypothetical protein U0599_09565 [Vicinamibacteria bacterium]
MSYLSLDAARIARTIDLLAQRVEMRFPASGLARVVRELDGIARRTSETAAFIRRPILALRVAVLVVLASVVALVAASFASLRVQLGPMSWAELAQGVEASINDLLFLGAAVFFLFTLETRVKRRRALAAIQELRSIAHVIDMHQLTKDPEWVLDRGRETGLLPQRSMTRFELSRYLDYCSEALSLTGKLAALYIQDSSDAVALQAVNEVEDLTTGLSRKIWQKLMILYSIAPELAAGDPEARPGPGLEP